jgi:hypothetical protein
LVLPDVGYVDFGKSDYHEVFGGGGAIVYRGKHVTWLQEILLTRAIGPNANRATYLQPWTLVSYSIPGTKLQGQTVYFVYCPLNSAARVQHVLERAKLERDFQHFKVGAGYRGYQFGDRNWEHKPFVTTTIKAGGLGSLELWVQRLPGNSVQVQLRYAVSFIQKVR